MAWVNEVLTWLGAQWATPDGRLLVLFSAPLGALAVLLWKYGGRLVDSADKRYERKVDQESASITAMRDEATRAVDRHVAALNDRIDTLEVMHEQCTTHNAKLIAHVARCDADLAATQTRVALLERQENNIQDRLEALTAGVQYLRDHHDK